MGIRLLQVPKNTSEIRQLGRKSGNISGADIRNNWELPLEDRGLKFRVERRGLSDPCLDLDVINMPQGH